jgi:hypothetical protein
MELTPSAGVGGCVSEPVRATGPQDFLVARVGNTDLKS